jgi:hypothetical protein
VTASASAAGVTSTAASAAPSSASAAASYADGAEAASYAEAPEAAFSEPVRKPIAAPPAEPPSGDGVRLGEWWLYYPVDWIGLARRHVFGKIRAALRCGYVCWSVFRGSSADACQ